VKLGLFTSLDIIYIAIQLTTIKEQQKKKNYCVQIHKNTERKNKKNPSAG